ncbi:hypothetical protein YC2023_023941 [Brassica napus]
MIKSVLRWGLTDLTTLYGLRRRQLKKAWRNPNSSITHNHDKQVRNRALSIRGMKNEN